MRKEASGVSLLFMHFSAWLVTERKYVKETLRQVRGGGTTTILLWVRSLLRRSLTKEGPG
nr:hypothetical protein Q903MT_gene2674 [Picea sitchensis]